MKRFIIIALIVLSGMLFYSCATTCQVLPPASAAQGQGNK